MTTTKKKRKLGGYCHGGRRPERRRRGRRGSISSYDLGIRRPRKVDPKFAVRVIEHAVKIGLHSFHFGSCGPAAVAINKVLFDGLASYVIASTKPAFERGRMSGHVAVYYDSRFYDYKGKCDVAELVAYVRGDEFVVISDVPEKLVRDFFPGEPFDVAEKILRQAVADVRKKRCAAAIREHKRELAEARKSLAWERHPTVKAIAKVWQTKFAARGRRRKVRR